MARPVGIDERGIAHLLLGAVGTGVLIGVILVGWTILNSKSSNNPQSGNNESAYSKCMNANNNDSTICSFESHYVPLSKASYTATITVTSPQNTVSNINYESDGKGNSELIGTANGQQLYTIDLNGNTYIKESSSEWLEYPSGSTDTPAQTDPLANMVVNVGTTGLSFLKLGIESCGSSECYKYTISDKNIPGSSQTIWFDTSTYQLKQWSYSGPTGKTDMTINYQPVTVSAPSPVKVLQ